MTWKTIVCIGEAMVEFRRADDQFWQQGFAGDVLNVGWALRALLAESEVTIKFLSRVGEDCFSESFYAFLVDSGISTDLLERDPDRTIGLYTIETDAGGERSFSYWRGQSAARYLSADPERLRAQVGTADMVYVSGITLAILLPQHRDAFLSTLLDLKGSGTTIAFDPNIRPHLWEDPATMKKTIADTARLADIVLPTFEDEAHAFGDAETWATIARYKRLGAREICVKNGVDPTCYTLDDDSGQMDVPYAVKAVDTTGAGDGFNGAYLASRFAGAGVPAAIRTGQAVSRAVVGERGALIDMASIREANKGVSE